MERNWHCLCRTESTRADSAPIGYHHVLIVLTFPPLAYARRKSSINERFPGSIDFNVFLGDRLTITEIGNGA